MSDPYIGEIRMFAGTFAPRSWALCDGQLLAISGNEALFSLLGTIYGGDGHTTFGLPDLRGRVPIHMGQGAGLSNRQIGQKAGSQTATPSVAQLPAHTHEDRVASAAGTASGPTGNHLGSSPSVRVFRPVAPGPAMGSSSVGDDGGGSQSHNNIQPFQVINFIIALTGAFPSRT